LKNQSNRNRVSKNQRVCELLVSPRVQWGRGGGKSSRGKIRKEPENPFWGDGEKGGGKNQGQGLGRGKKYFNWTKDDGGGSSEKHEKCGLERGP